MTAVTVSAAVTPSDRLALTLCLAILLHAIIILGVTFVAPVVQLPNYETMEIVLVNSRTEEKPKNPQLLAQANQVGGGEEDDDPRPATPIASSVHSAVPSVPMAPTPALTPDLPAPSVEPQVEVPPMPEEGPSQPPASPTQVAENESASALQELVAEPMKEPDKHIAQSLPANREPVSQDKPAANPAESKSGIVKSEAEAEAPTPPAAPTPSGAALIARSFEIASLDAEIAERMEAKAKRPRRKFISATTSEYKYAAYMEAWRAKVERIGNLNYPDEARRQRLSGSLILDVALNTDGSINEITVRRPSDFPVLDDAAIRIVRLAAPYAAFPDEFNNEVDILHITRTWQFKSGQRFASQ